MSDCPGTFCGSRVHQRPILLHCLGCQENTHLRAHLARAKALLVVLGRNRIYLPPALVERIDAMLCELDLPDAPKGEP